MKLDKLSTLFPDPEMCDKLWGSSVAEEKGQDEIVGNIFKQSDPKKFLSLVLSRIQECVDEETNVGTCKQLWKKIQKHHEFQPFEKDVKPVEIPLPKKREKGEFGKFPEESIPLAHMKERAAELRAKDLAKAKEIIDQIKSDVAYDPTMAKSEAASSEGDSSPVKFWDDVTTPFGCFRMYGCPKDLTAVSLLFKKALEDGVHVFVSLHETGDHAFNRIPDFWEDKQLSKLTLPGWTIKKTEEKELISRPKDREKQMPPRVVESTLVAEDEQKHTKIALTHLHLDGWPDQSPMPCGEELFHVLQMRIGELCKTPEERIGINCIGGIGRTGTTAVARYCKQLIDSGATELNIPEIIYLFRRQRPSLIGQPSHLAHLYAWAGQYYEERTRQRNSAPAAPSAQPTSAAVLP